MDAITGFKEAAMAFQQQAVYKAYAAARRRNDGDAALQRMIGVFDAVREELRSAMQMTPRDHSEVERLNSHMNTLYGQIMAHEGMAEYSRAKEDVEYFVGFVNTILGVAIDGGDPMAVAGPAQTRDQDAGCGGCAGCSGCG